MMSKFKLLIVFLLISVITFSPSVAFQQETKVYQNIDYGFSIEYPNEWAVYDEIIQQNNWARIVTLASDSKWNASIGIDFFTDDSGFQGLQSQEYLDKLIDDVGERCASVSFDQYGFICTNYSVLDSKSAIVDGKTTYQLSYTFTRQWDDGGIVNLISWLTKIPVGNDSWVIYSETLQKNSQQYENVMKESIESVRVGIDSPILDTSQLLIPDWIKNVAGFWCDGQIPDSSFVDAIKYLIDNRVIVIPLTKSSPESTEEVPSWIKNNACWWSSGQISDSDFATGIEYLVKQGIIQVELDSETTEDTYYIQLPERSSFAVGGAIFHKGIPWYGPVTAPTETADETEIVPIGEKTAATLLVYMVASDLESEFYAATEDLNEMMMSGSTSDVNVIVQSGGSLAKPDEYRSIDFTSVKRLLIKEGDLEEIEDLGKKNMGDPNTLSDFVLWGIAKYPAEKYYLILWNHGSGFHGFGYDDISDDYLTSDELSKSFADAKSRYSDLEFEMIGFDACLMATLEVAEIVDEYSKYLVASEEIEPGWGWDYTAILSTMTTNPDQDGKALGKVIADSFVEHTKVGSQQQGTDDSRIITLSVIDLSKINNISSSIDALADSIIAPLEHEDVFVLFEAFDKSERYGVEKNFDSGHTDLKNILHNIGLKFPLLKETTTKIEGMVDDAVVYNVKGHAKPNSNGISTLIPLTRDMYDVFSYDDSGFESLNRYIEGFLVEDDEPPSIFAEISDGVITGNYEGKDIESFWLYITSEPYAGEHIEVFSEDEYDTTEFPGGKIEFEWDGYLPQLCNSESCINTLPEYEYNADVTLVYVPVRIEGPGVDTTADLIYDITDEENPIFIGAWPDNEDETIYERNLLPLQEGYLIYSYTIDWNITTNEESAWLEYGPIEVDEQFEFTWEIYEDRYWIYLEVCDFSGNCNEVGPFEITIAL